MATWSIKPLRDIGALAPAGRVRRHWQVLLAVMVLCLVLRVATAAVRFDEPARTSDLLDAMVQLLGPCLLFVTVLLARTTARGAQVSARLEQAAFADALTGLPNRRSFDRRLGEAIATSRAERSPLCLVLLDIDHFKQVNDGHGHAAGDAVLKAMASALRRTVSSLDLTCRIGGEEFAIIVPGRSPREAAALMEDLRIVVAAATTRIAGEAVVRVTASLGVAALQGEDTAETLFARADDALYAAKRGGRNRVRLAA